MSAEGLRREMQRMFARAADDDLARYASEHNGRLLWYAYQGYRAAGLPVPGAVLQVFDRWAAALFDADTPADTLRALELQGNRRKHLGARHLALAERWHIIAQDVRRRVDRGMAPTVAIRAAAERWGLSEPEVRKAYYRRR